MRKNVAPLLLTAAVILVSAVCCDAFRTSDLLHSIYANDVARVRRLIEAGARVNGANPDGFTPLMRAAGLGRAEIARLLLLAEGASVRSRDRQGRSALGFAVDGQHLETTRVLLIAALRPGSTDLPLRELTVLAEARVRELEASPDSESVIERRALLRGLGLLNRSR